MKLMLSSINNGRQFKNITYRGGMTPVIKNQIANTNPESITHELLQRSIESDFRNNKLIAWASKKCIDLIELINQIFNLNFGFPQGIFVEDFAKLKNVSGNTYGFCNLAPTKLYLDETTLVPEKTIFFNSFEEKNPNAGNKVWNNISQACDFYHAKGKSATNSFFEIFLHEFSHAIHEDNLINKLGGNSFLNEIQKILQKEYLEQFGNKLSPKISSICSYALENPLESVACDLSARIINNVELETSAFNRDFAKYNPYDKNFIIKKYFSSKDLCLEKILNRFWNGNFSI